MDHPVGERSRIPDSHSSWFKILIHFSQLINDNKIKTIDLQLNSCLFRFITNYLVV